MQYQEKITVFTPTYNRAYILENLYRSLQRQTCTQFEWLVVDDGSADNTKELFEVWQKEENLFPIPTPGPRAGSQGEFCRNYYFGGLYLLPDVQLQENQRNGWELEPFFNIA